MDTQLKDNIKFNCDVSDARFWGYFSICGLLLRYRDLYRSEQGLKPWTNIDRADIGNWIQAKEARWPDLEQQPFRSLTIEGKIYDPFDVNNINDVLRARGLVYGAGYGMYMKPTFFLAELKSKRDDGGLTVHTCGPELVRDLFTAPAMLQERSIFLRREPLLILLHFKFSELNARQNPALEDAFAQFGFRNRQIVDETFEKRLEALVDRYAEIILAHEIAEHGEGIPEWKDILTAAGDRKNEHYLRALKDLIADTSETGPLKRISERKDRGALGLSVAFMEGFQRVLFPELKDAYAGFIRTGAWDVVETARKRGYARFIAERQRVLQAFRDSSGQEDFSERLREIITTP
jgi:hypothetical protein